MVWGDDQNTIHLRDSAKGAEVGDAHWLKTALVGAAKLRKRVLLPGRRLV